MVDPEKGKAIEDIRQRQQVSYRPERLVVVSRSLKHAVGRLDVCLWLFKLLPFGS